MSLSEFDIIKRYFTKPHHKNPSVITGIGDDAAILKVPDGFQLVISADTLVSGTHFTESADPYDIGYKALAVNISDMAAMGARPLYVTMSITLEKNDADWLDAMSRGFFYIADKYSLDLIGGDVTRGPVSICVQIMGLVPDGQALMRSGAKAGDDIYVTGTLGMAAFALYAKNLGYDVIDEACLNRLNRPEPRLDIGMALRNLSTACIDISDGLQADLSHILSASKVGAIIDIFKIPMYEELGEMTTEQAINLAINVGDDYELCFTSPECHKDDLRLMAENTPVKLTKIGKVISNQDLIWQDRDGEFIEIARNGYKHF